MKDLILLKTRNLLIRLWNNNRSMETFMKRLFPKNKVLLKKNSNFRIEKQNKNKVASKSEPDGQFHKNLKINCFINIY